MTDSTMVTFEHTASVSQPDDRSSNAEMAIAPMVTDNSAIATVTIDIGRHNVRLALTEEEALAIEERLAAVRERSESDIGDKEIP